MTTLYLHVGMQKTGSSYLQSVFAEGRRKLAENGILYPVRAKNRRGVGAITSGNGTLLSRTRFEADTEYRGALFSRERFYFELRDGYEGESPATLQDRYGADRVEVLVFVRNPIEYLKSHYVQIVKRDGASTTIDEAEGLAGHFRLIAEFLSTPPAFSNLHFTVRNYSVVRKRLADVAAEWLGVPAFEAEKTEAVGTVNRSLSRSELEIQRGLNAVLGKSGGLLSDRLCNELPHVRAEHVAPSPDAAARFLERLAPAMEVIAPFLPEGEALSTEVPETTPEERSDAALITHEQANFVGRAFGEAIVEERRATRAMRIKYLEAMMELHALKGEDEARAEAARVRAALIRRERKAAR